MLKVMIMINMFSLFSVPIDPKYEVIRRGGDIWFEDPFHDLVIEWDKSVLDAAETVQVDLVSL